VQGLNTITSCGPCVPEDITMLTCTYLFRITGP
jgi:hypothetical protein